MDLSESLIGQYITEQATNTGFQAKDGLIRWCSQIQDTIVQPRVLIDANVETLRIVCKLWTRSILNLQRQLCLGLRNDEYLLDTQLQQLLRARLNLVGHRHRFRLNINDALLGYAMKREDN